MDIVIRMNHLQKQSLTGGNKSEWGIWNRFGAACGIVFALLLISGLAIEIGAGFPPTGDSSTEIAHYFSANQSAFKLYVYAALATIPFQILFFATLFVSLRSMDKGSIWPVVGITSAVFGNAATLQVNIVWGALTWYVNLIGDSPLLQVLWTMYHLGGFTLGLISATILIGFGAALFKMKGAWRLIGIFGILSGIYSAIVFAVLIPSGGGASPLSGLGYVLMILWTLLAAIRLFFGPPVGASAH